MKAIVTGMIATYPVGGMFWDYAQYIIGLEKFGFEVYYLEDTGLPTYIPNPEKYIENSLRLISKDMTKRWHYRTAEGVTYGLSHSEMEGIIAGAEIFLNTSGGCLLREIYMKSKHKVLVDTDPGLNHFVNYPKWDKDPGWQGTLGYRAHDHFFTYAENFNNEECILPDLGLNWLPTRPVVAIEYWANSIQPSDRWTTVMSWKPYQHYKDNVIKFEGRTYGAKEIEFERIKTLPSQVDVNMEVAMAGKGYPRTNIESHGWSIVEAGAISKTPQTYREYIQKSRGEFSVAKNVYVDTCSGWFSCRSICYMASGRPVVLQDTGFSKHIPCGKGVLAFSNLEEAVASIEKVESNYQMHSEAAMEIAREYFSTEVVIGDLLNKIELCT